VEEQRLHLLALSMVKGLGPVMIKNMIAYCGSAQEVWRMPNGKLSRIPGVGERAMGLLKRANTLEEAESELKYCDKHGIQCLSYLEPDYPQLLKYIYNAPLLLFKQGNIGLNDQPNIAIVGTRKPTEQGRCIVEEFAAFYADKRINVVSGLAFGIDISAHRSVLQAKGKTTAVLGHGLDRIYPASHTTKAREMLEAGGILTEYVSGTEPDAAHFPARNRIIAGICKAVIVIEAAESGGALITAQMAFDQNREVYAIPGRLSDKRSVGCNRLIRDQIAKLITTPQEVLDDLEIQWKERPSGGVQGTLELELPPDLSTEEIKVMNILKKDEAVVDQISIRTGIPMHQLQPLLLTMEFKGLILQAPGKRFRIK